MHLLLVANIAPFVAMPRAPSSVLAPSSFLPREKVLVDSFASNYKCLTSSNKKLFIRILIKFFLLLPVRHLLLEAMHLLLVANIAPFVAMPRAPSSVLAPSSFLPREKVPVDSFASNYKCLTSSNKKLFIRILIKFFLLLPVRHLLLEAMHLLLVANIAPFVAMPRAPSSVLAPSSFLPPPRARAREKVLVDSFASNYKCLTSSNKKLFIRILIKFFLLLPVRHLLLEAMHLLLVANIAPFVAMPRAPSSVLAPSSFLPPPARARARKGPSRFLC